MIPENKISKFLSMLIFDTQKDKTNWEISYDRILDSLEGEQKLVGNIYKTSYKNQKLRLYKYSDLAQIDEFDFRQIIYFKLEFIDDNGKNIWSFPYYIREISDLYNTVQIKSSGLDKYFNEIVPDDDFDF